jgi:hypothetical protein
MLQETLRKIEAKSAQVRRRFRVNPDRFVRWGLAGGAVVGSVVLVIVGLTPGSAWSSVGEILVRSLIVGAWVGALLGGLFGFFVSVMYEMSCGVADFVERLCKPKPRPVDDVDDPADEHPIPLDRVATDESALSTDRDRPASP